MKTFRDLVPSLVLLSLVSVLAMIRISIDNIKGEHRSLEGTIFFVISIFIIYFFIWVGLKKKKIDIFIPDRGFVIAMFIGTLFLFALIFFHIPIFNFFNI
jgi:hypothetical protein